jgi:hypothetical protein
MSDRTNPSEQRKMQELRSGLQIAAEHASRQNPLARKIAEARKLGYTPVIMVDLVKTPDDPGAESLMNITPHDIVFLEGLGVGTEDVGR